MQQTTPPRTPEESFGQAVSMFRTNSKLSQRDFATKLSERGMPVDASAVSRIENGSRSVRLVEAMTIAEVLGVDLDFLISGSKTPSQEFQAMRRRTDAALRSLQASIVDTAYALWEVRYHLEKHPELLETLEDAELGRPSTPADYLEWVAARAERWTVMEDDYIITDSPEEADQIVKVIARFAKIHVGMDKAVGSSDGKHPEEA